MERALPPNEVDHINGNPSDNRWCNLRHATRSENSRNMPRRFDNSSGLTGVYWKKRHKRWYASIKTNGKFQHLGCFTSFFEAACARKSEERRLGFHVNHGRSAPLPIPEIDDE